MDLFTTVIKDGVIRLRDKEPIAAACIYLSCRSQGFPRPLVEVAASTGVLDSALSYAVDLIGERVPGVRVYIRPQQLIPRFAAESVDKTVISSSADEQAAGSSSSSGECISNNVTAMTEMATRLCVHLEKWQLLPPHPPLAAAGCLLIACALLRIPLNIEHLWRFAELDGKHQLSNKEQGGGGGGVSRIDTYHQFYTHLLSTSKNTSTSEAVFWGDVVKQQKVPAKLENTHFAMHHRMLYLDVGKKLATKQNYKGVHANNNIPKSQSDSILSENGKKRTFTNLEGGEKHNTDSIIQNPPAPSLSSTSTSTTYNHTIYHRTVSAPQLKRLNLNSPLTTPFGSRGVRRGSLLLPNGNTRNTPGSSNGSSGYKLSRSPSPTYSTSSLPSSSNATPTLTLPSDEGAAENHNTGEGNEGHHSHLPPVQTYEVQCDELSALLDQVSASIV